MNGKIEDVIIDDSGFRTEFIVWADNGSEEIIRAIEGVIKVVSLDNGTNHHVYFDPRYDREWIKTEIVSRIKTRSKEPLKAVPKMEVDLDELKEQLEALDYFASTRGEHSKLRDLNILMKRTLSRLRLHGVVLLEVKK
jgi:ribosome-binding ATPase YchF (GTP1/OBG family)